MLALMASKVNVEQKLPMESPSFTEIDPRYEQLFYGRQVQELNSGAFSVVSVVDDETVIKATSCIPSANFLTALLAIESIATAPWQRPIAGLPRVFEGLGVIAEDADGQPYFGFRMERLFDEPMQNMQRGVADTQKQALLEKLSAAYSAYQRIQNSEQNFEFTDTEASIEVACRLANDSTNPLREGFAFIAAFLVRQTATKTIMDLMRPENLMFSREGELILADPVAGVYDELGLNVPSPDCTTDKGAMGTSGLRCSTKAMAVAFQNCTTP